jgi:hypothetical protein
MNLLVHQRKGKETEHSSVQLIDSYLMPFLDGEPATCRARPSQLGSWSLSSGPHSGQLGGPRGSPVFVRTASSQPTQPADGVL